MRGVKGENGPGLNVFHADTPPWPALPQNCADVFTERERLSVSETRRVGGGLVPVVGGGPNREREVVRFRRYEFVQARQRIMRPSLSYLNAWGALGDVVSHAKSYVKKVKDKAIVLRNVETDALAVVPYYTRFSDGYYQGAIRKIKKLGASNAVFLTLTLDPKRFISLDNAMKDLRVGWNRLLTMLRKRCRRLQFVKVVEFQKNGSPHIHVLFLGISRLIDANELREFWDKSYGAGTMVYLKRIKNDGRQVVAYLTKYIKKYLDRPDEEVKGGDGLTDAVAFNQLALSWALNLRAYSVSRGILDKGPMTNSNRLACNGGGLWEFLGVKPLVDVWWLDGLPYSQVKGYLDEVDTPLFGGV